MKKNYLKFILIFILFTLYFIIEKLINNNIFSLIARLLLIIISIYLIKKDNKKRNINDISINRKHLYYLIIPLMLNYVSSMGKIDISLPIVSIIVSLVNILTIVSLEELVFRGISFLYIANKYDELSKKDIIFISLLYTFYGMSGVIFDLSLFTNYIMQGISYYILGYTMLSIYLNCHNMYLLVSYHFIFNFIPEIFKMVSSNPSAYGNIIFYMSFILIQMSFVLISKYILKDTKNYEEYNEEKH